MFCLIDVSGSMSEVRKDIAKRFFILLPLFLLRACERIEVALCVNLSLDTACLS